jgi:formyl-CoA transferase
VEIVLQVDRSFETWILKRSAEPVCENSHLIAPTDLYPCAPGGPNDYLYIMTVTTRMVDALFTAIDRPELATDPRFATQEARQQNGDELHAIIAEWTRQRTKYEAMETLGAAGVPCGAVLDSGDLFRDKHLRARNMIITIDHPVRGKWETLAPPVHLSASKVEVKPAPLLGQHTADVLREELGLDDAALQQMAAAGVITLAESTAKQAVS